MKLEIVGVGQVANLERDHRDTARAINDQVSVFEGTP